MTLDSVSLHAAKGHFRSLLVSNIIWLSSFRGLPFTRYPCSLKPLYLFSNETVVSFLPMDELQKAHALWLVTHGCFAKVIHFSDPKGHSIYIFFRLFGELGDLCSRVGGWFRITLRYSYPVWESKPVTRMPLDRTSLFLGKLGWVTCTLACTSLLIWGESFTSVVHWLVPPLLCF